MNNTLAHRGPDDDGIWYDESKRIGLAHRRLSIIDTSPAGKQPMWDSGEKVVISFNGEIYNYRELKKELIQKGYQFKNETDTEVILNLYLHSKYDMLEKLDGIFAFAIWDTRSDELFIARDGMGVKPLYYYEKDDQFAFASELKSLLHLPISKDIDYEAIYWYLTYLWCPAPMTMLKNVKKLEPGYALVKKINGISKKWMYYQIPTSNDYLKSDVSEISAHLSKLLDLAVKKQMVSDVPVGAFLSGGLDSSSIVSFARNYTDHKFECFTIDTNDTATKSEGFTTDLPYAKKAAEYLGVDLKIISIGPEMADSLPKMIYHLDEPQADPAPLNVYFISQLAREHGVKVLLSGAGGDDLFTGYRRHAALNAERFWNWIPGRLISDFSRIVPSSNPLLRRFKKVTEYAYLKGDNRVAAYFHWINPVELHQLFCTDFLNLINPQPFSKPLTHTIASANSELSSLEKILLLEQKHFLTDHNLSYTDKMSMAAGVEVRVPFLDKELLAHSWKIPMSLKQNGIHGKWILKKAMENQLPKDIIYRSKSGFGAPVRSWVHNELSGMFDDIFNSNDFKNRAIFNTESVKKLKERDRMKRINASYTILSIACIEMWFQIFIDKKNFHF